MRKGRCIVAITGVIAAASVSALSGPAAAWADTATPWQVGAATVDTTPQLFDAAQDAIDFPPIDPDPAGGGGPMLCPREIFNGPRVWRFEEPYIDGDGSGDFNYPVSGDPGTAPVPEPFCDYNHNHRWDGMYLSGGANHHAVPSPHPIPGYNGPAHDPSDARAVAITGDNGKTDVIVSVVAQGIFENYIREARDQAKAAAIDSGLHPNCGHIDEMVVSSNHNESSPDTIGIYGAPADPTDNFGINSSIDEYYMDYLVGRIAKAALDACDARQPASLREHEMPVPVGLKQEIHNFPTVDDETHKTPLATDPKVRLLQARDASGQPILTMMNLADHNQDIGQSDTFEESHTISADWPGYFHRRLEHDLGGKAMFLAADIGSMEDLITEPSLPDPPCNSGGNGCYAQVEATGTKIADEVAAAIGKATPLAPGPVTGKRTEFCAPLENNLFRAAAAAGLFGERQGFTEVGGQCLPTGALDAGTATSVRSSVAVLGIGPDLQFLTAPGEAFPALMLGTPWGAEDASCPGRPNPPVPTWHASAKHRFQIGLADDLIGYLKPGWSFADDPGIFVNDPTSGNFDSCDKSADEAKGHHHTLESEGVGPTASNKVAQLLTDLLDQTPDPAAEIRLGRYILPDGSLSHRPKDTLESGKPEAVGVWLAEPGATSLNDPTKGTIVATSAVGAFGTRKPDATGEFIDFDGAPQPAPDYTTRGMLVRSSGGGVSKRYYVDVFPALTTANLDAAKPPPPPPPPPCSDTLAPQTTIRRAYGGSRHVKVRGVSADHGCAHLERVYVSVAKLSGGRCRFLRADGSLTGRRSCSSPVQLLADGRSSWSKSIASAGLPSGGYRAQALARDSAGNRERPSSANTEAFRIR
ncbi:MAG: hypothetical protein QOG09_1273 [Solirubrobacterales bacterium]|nr:hypothetical protein [Solirubrobacterales bacterium]